MAWGLRLGSGVEDRLQRPAAQGPGWLVGAVADSTLAVLSSIGCRSFLLRKEPSAAKPLGVIDEDAEAAELQMLVPGGLKVLGAYGAVAPGGGASQLRDAAQALLSSVPSQLVDDLTPLVAAVVADGAVHYFVQSGASCEPLQPSAPLEESWLGDHFTLLRCHLPVRLDVFNIKPVPTPHKPWPAVLHVRSDALAAAAERATAPLCSPAAVFLAPAGPDSPAVLYGEGTDTTVGGSLTSPVTLVPLIRQSPSGSGPDPAAAPMLSWQPIRGEKGVNWHATTVRVDVLAYVRRGASTADAVSSALQPALRTQLQVVRALLDMGDTGFDEDGAALPTFRALHFQPPGWAHVVTTVYPMPADDNEEATAAAEQNLRDRRLQIHARLGLQADRPLFRLANALTFDGGANGEGGGGGRLSDVHVGLPAAPVQGGSVHLVSGHYDYHHYMQDKFDDKGWGCAYRSLQTLVSWFRRQQYTARQPPSHREVQDILVSLGDKERAFAGSKQWVGAIELSYVLDEVLGVQCKVLTVSRGADLPSRAREIAHHFDTQGTPIMVGGGVLAYTLLGIHYNPSTGDAAFLILDPHYTGADDLKRIQQGQWVAWKQAGDKAAAGGDLFVKDAFYNLLCPQRPAVV